MNAMIGLECLFSPDDEKNITNTLSACVVSWLHDSDTPPDETVFVESFLSFKDHYRIRSAIVHGKLDDPIKLNDAAKNLLNALSRCIGISLANGTSKLNTEHLMSFFCKSAAGELKKRQITIGSRSQRRRC